MIFSQKIVRIEKRKKENLDVDRDRPTLKRKLFVMLSISPAPCSPNALHILRTNPTPNLVKVLVMGISNLRMAEVKPPRIQ